MASQVKRYKIIYEEDVPKDILDFVASDTRLGYAKGGLYDHASIRARLLIINQAWSNQASDVDLRKRLMTMLTHLGERGHLLAWEALK